MISRRSVLRAAKALSTMVAVDGIASPTKLVARDMTSAKAADYRMPLESGPHQRTFMQWPTRTSIYGSRRALQAVQSRIALIAASIVSFEPVVILAPEGELAAVRQMLDPAIALWPVRTEDLWCRDSGPTFVVSSDGALAVSELGFNGWGNKQSHADDSRIAGRIAERLKLSVFANGIAGEGGAVEVDGAGTAMAHESCWINRNRNAGGKAEVERRLLDALGADRMIWAPGVKGADITDFHIDALARFVKPGQVVIQLGNKPDAHDPWSISAFQTYDNLRSARDAQGRKLDIVVIPEPVRTRSRADDFVSSYVNFYVCNGAIIGAEFGDDKADAKAAEILQALYPGRTIVSLNVDPIGEAGGGIHCATQQQPAGKL